MLYIVGGKQRETRSVTDNDPNWYSYQSGLVLKVDTDNDVVETCFEYMSREGTCLPGDAVLFKSGSIAGEEIYLCTQTEVLICSLPSFDVVQHISLPLFNDVHHVQPFKDNSLIVANTGLEMVIRLSRTGDVLDLWNVLFKDPWQDFDQNLDYRMGVSTKPHQAHPNYVFTIGDDIWATRFEKKDAVCVTDTSKSIQIDLERVHDGLVHDDKIYFTTVDGHVVIYNQSDLQHVQTIDLNAAHPANTLLGWCRGILVDEDVMWVGFSRIRPTKFRGALSWIRTGFQTSAPTHIGCYCLKTGKCLKEIDLEPYGLNAVFSILK